MKPRHQVSVRAIELIKRFEGYRRTAAALPDGRWTIGYGHVKSARAGTEVSEQDAEALLIYDLLEVTKAVNELTFTPLTQNQFDALVCFASNIGLENFRRSSVLRRINEGSMLQAAGAFEMWRKAEFEGERIVVDALVRRRSAEKALFLTPAEGWVPTPTPVVRPRVDYEVSSAEPRERPYKLIVPLEGEETSVHEEAPSENSEVEPVSPTTAAAENLAARLQALVPDAGPAGTAEGDAGIDLSPPTALTPVEDELEPTVADVIVPAFAADAPLDPEPAFTFAPDTEEPDQTAEQPVDAIEAADPETPPLPFREAMDAPAGFNLRSQPQTVAREPRLIAEEPPSIEAPTTTRKPDLSIGQIPSMKLAFWPLVGLGVGGLSFVFAILWGLFAEPGGGVFGAWTVSWAAGLIGIGCVVGAVYVLLERLGGSEE